MHNDTHAAHLMELGPKIPVPWIDAVQHLRRNGIASFIAGGAVRDLLLNRPHKDVDVWVTQCYAKECAAAAEAGGWRVIVGHDYSINDLCAVYEFDHGNETINVIVVKADTEAEIVGRFDFGISRAVIRVHKQVTLSDIIEGRRVAEVIIYPEFTEDLDRKVFKVRHDNGVARTLARWERIRERYPDWTFEDLEDPFATL